MQCAFLQLDDSLPRQGDLIETGRGGGGRVLDARDLGPALRLWGRPAALAALRARLRDQLAIQSADEIVFAGSGDFHHVSPMLLTRALERHDGDVTVIHFDNHPDWVKFEPGLHCGSWVGETARHARVARVLTIGVCSRDVEHPGRKGADLSLVADQRVEIYPYRAPRGATALSVCGRSWPSIETIGEAAFADLLCERVGTRAIYLTIDKDVLRAQDAITNWDQGRASLDFVVGLISRLAAHHDVIGADVVGDWSEPCYGGGLAARWLKRGEAMLDQPWRRPDDARACALNQKINLALLALFAEIAP